MTTFYPFAQWIESSATADTVVLAFGGWWDADEDAGGGVTVDYSSNYIFRSIVIKGSQC